MKLPCSTRICSRMLRCPLDLKIFTLTVYAYFLWCILILKNALFTCIAVIGLGTDLHRRTPRTVTIHTKNCMPNAIYTINLVNKASSSNYRVDFALTRFSTREYIVQRVDDRRTIYRVQIYVHSSGTDYKCDLFLWTINARLSQRSCMKRKSLFHYGVKIIVSERKNV